jgi:uncharacterized protein
MTGKGNFRTERWYDVAVPRLLADEMLGRLARYLRMLGCDTVYARGWTDDEIVARAQADRRTLLTRDRALAGRVAPVILLRTVDLPGQLREVVANLPELPRAVAFERCTVCNGLLRPSLAPAHPGPRSPRGPTDPLPGPVFECGECGHRYWEGSHTASIRRHLAEWVAEVPR